MTSKAIKSFLEYKVMLILRKFKNNEIYKHVSNTGVKINLLEDEAIKGTFQLTTDSVRNILKRLERKKIIRSVKSGNMLIWKLTGV